MSPELRERILQVAEELGYAGPDAAGRALARIQHHTGAEVPVWASGPRAADIQGTIDQTDIFGVLTNTRGPAGAADTTRWRWSAARSPPRSR